ncbi:helix-turn-helix domain-containing protein [Aerococcus christensenii]|uniref:helix-turn-helix domain-containing protein n=1 Tax=Aerococcus christensenii TaxID=87541 RepID=UPI003F41C21F
MKDSKIIFGQMIDYFRKQNNLTMEELGKKLGKAKSSISRWISGERYPKIEEIEQIANFFNTDVYTLIFGFDYKENIFPTPLLTQITDTAAKLHTLRQKKVLTFAQDQLDEQEGNSINILSYSDFTCYGAVSAGTGEWLEDEYKEEVSLPTSIVPKHHFDFVLRVNGNSMEPLFKNREYVFVKKIDEVRSGQIGVFIVDGEAYLKKAYIEKDHLRLVSLNKAYDDLLFDSLNDIKVVGTIIM